jgi:N-acetylneuraminate synthase
VKPIVIATPKGPRAIGPGQPVFVVAELSGNHNQSKQRALDLVDAAAKAGADAIKLQTYTADTLTIDSDKPYFRVDVAGAWQGDTLYSLYQKAYTPWEWQKELKQRAEQHGLPLFSSPFDESAVDFLESIEVPLYKVASLEIRDVALLRAVARTGKPVIISRGAASVADIERALRTLRGAGCANVMVLHCVSAYPARPSEMNLSTIPDIARRFDVVSGLSDHTLGTTVAIASVALGAHVIEKHFTLRRADGGPDSEFSLEPEEFAQLVAGVREASEALGAPNYEAHGREAEIQAYRRSLFVVADVRAGELFGPHNVRAIRPGQGLPPHYLEQVLGKPATCSIERGTPLALTHVAGLNAAEASVA